MPVGENMAAPVVTILPPAPADFLRSQPQLHPTIAHIVHQRGYHTVEAIEHYLHPVYERDITDPFLFTDMPKVVQRLVQAKDKQEVVLVYGDYDADGVCSTVLLVTALRACGLTNVQLYLPHRDTEGYGLNQAALDQFIQRGVQLIITVDCGISNDPEVTYATEHGIDVIVTDHHVEPLQLPTTALAIINPQVKTSGYPFAMLAGVGVAFKVAQALGQHFELGPQYEKWLLDLVAISTITDCMPLTHENRALVHYGLIVLNKTRRPGLQALIKATHTNGAAVTTQTIGFRLGPWINAAGRIDHANTAVALLLSNDDTEINQLVQKLADTNTERQRQTEQMYKAAHEQITAALTPNQTVVLAVGTDWPLGLVGLVAGKLVNAFQKPAFVLTHNRGRLSGSGRSVTGLNMIKTLQSIEHLLDRYGGHAMACGFTLKPDITPQQFHETFIAATATTLQQLDLRPTITVVDRLPLTAVTWQLIEQLDWLQPYGEKNSEPIFIIEDCTLKDFQTIGSKQQHLRLVLSDATGRTVKAVAFGAGDQVDQLRLNQPISAIAEVQVNEWNGRRDIQVQIKSFNYELAPNHS